MRQFVAWLLPVVFFVFALAVLYPAVQEGFHDGWVRWEFYTVATLMIGFCLLLTVRLYLNLQQQHWTQRYLSSIGIILTLPVYYSAIENSGHDIPRLFGLLLVSVFFVVPVLLVLHGAAFLLRERRFGEAAALLVVVVTLYGLFFLSMSQGQ